MPSNEIIINGKVYNLSDPKGMGRLLKALAINVKANKGVNNGTGNNRVTKNTK